MQDDTNAANTARLLPLGSMASHLGIQAKDLRQAAENGEVPCIRIGERGLLFDPERVLAMLRRRARGEDVTGEGTGQ